MVDRLIPTFVWVGQTNAEIMLALYFKYVMLFCMNRDKIDR